MIPGLRFATLRYTIITLAVLTQFYIFFRARGAILASKRSARFKSVAVGTLGALMILCFVMNLYIMLRPIPWVDAPAAAQFGIFYPPAIWAIGSIFSALLLIVGEALAGILKLLFRLWRMASGRSGSLLFSSHRRAFLQAGASGLFSVPLLLSGYGAAYGGRNGEIEEVDLHFGCPLRVAHLTDIHAGIYMNRGQMRRYADRINALQPDLFVLTGDYISNSLSFLPGCLVEMARVRTRYGTFATLGNHEHWYASIGELEAIFLTYGVPLLQNAHQVIRTGDGPFAVAGIDDTMNGTPDLTAALTGIDTDMPTILLSHRPEIFPDAASRGIALTLSGHYHGGQIKLGLPGAGISLAHLRTPYPEEFYKIGESRLYVSRGIGTTFTPVRFNAPPEVTLFHLT